MKSIPTLLSYKIWNALYSNTEFGNCLSQPFDSYELWVNHERSGNMPSTSSVPLVEIKVGGSGMEYNQIDLFD